METADLIIDVHEQGCVVPVRAVPGAKSNGIIGVHQGALRVTVTQVAEKGKANQAILKVLAKGLGLKKSQLSLVSGETSRAKQIVVRDVTPEQFLERVRGLPNKP